VIDRRPITLSLIDMLTRGVKVDVFPAGAVPENAQAPFLVVAGTIAPVEFDESLEDDYSSMRFAYTITSVGERLDQTEAIADRVRRTLCQRKSTGWQVDFKDLPAGVTIINRESLSSGSVEVIGQAPKVLLNFPEEFALFAVAG